MNNFRSVCASVCLLALGLGWAAPTGRPAGGQTAPREIAITFDDLPATQSQSRSAESIKDMNARLLKSLAANKVPAIGFVNEGGLYRAGEVDERIAVLKAWLDAGLELGNHSFSHVPIDRTPLAAYKEDVIRGETVTRMLLAERGRKLRYYRHTQLRTGPTLEYKKGLDQFLAERGYTVAPVTIDNQDYVFAAVYDGAKRRGDKETMRRVVEAYVPYMEGMFEFFEKLSRDSLGYEVRQVLLLHVNELNADHFDDLARMMKRRGYSFVSLDRALEDKAYGLPDAQVQRGYSWIHRWMLARGAEMRPEPREPEFILKLFAETSNR